MNILIIAPEYPPKIIGGGGIVYRNLARELVTLGHKVTVYSGDFHNRKLFGTIKRTKDEMVWVHFIPLIPPPHIDSMNLTTYTPPTFLGLIFILKNIIQGKYDIIHLHGLGHPLIDIASLICILFQKRYVFTCHGIPKSPEIMGSVFRLAFRIYLITIAKFIVSKAKAITTVSQTLLKECRKRGLTNNKMITIPNGPNLDLCKVKPDELKNIEEIYSLKDKKVIFSIGRLAQNKGFQHLIEAMPYVISEFPCALAIIAGSGPYFTTLKGLVIEKKLSNHIKLIGWITEEEKVAFYKYADVFVFPSLSEPFGIVLLEALTMHKPIVAFNISPILEIIDGLLVPLGDIDGLADAILQILSDDKLRDWLVGNTYSQIKRFQWEQIVKLYINMYTEVSNEGQSCSQST